MKNVLSLATLAFLTLGLTGCGGGGGGGSTGGGTTIDTTTQTGTFIDAPVQGLKYETATQSGYTDENGNFKYKTGESITFKLGNLELGSAYADTIISPYTLAGDISTDMPSDKAVNIAMLLQSLDGNRSNPSILDVRKLKDHNFTNVNLNVTTNDMSTVISDLFADNSFSGLRDITNNTPVNSTTANSNMKTFVDNKFQEINKNSTEVYDLGIRPNAFSIVFDNRPGQWCSASSYCYELQGCGIAGGFTGTTNFVIYKNGSAKSSYVKNDNVVTDTCIVKNVYIPMYVDGNISNLNGIYLDDNRFYDGNLKVYFELDSPWSTAPENAVLTTVFNDGLTAKINDITSLGQPTTYNRTLKSIYKKVNLKDLGIYDNSN